MGLRPSVSSACVGPGVQAFLLGRIGLAPGGGQANYSLGVGVQLSNRRRARVFLWGAQRILELVIGGCAPKPPLNIEFSFGISLMVIFDYYWGCAPDPPVPCGEASK